MRFAGLCHRPLYPKRRYPSYKKRITNGSHAFSRITLLSRSNQEETEAHEKTCLSNLGRSLLIGLYLMSYGSSNIYLKTSEVRKFCHLEKSTYESYIDDELKKLREKGLVKLGRITKIKPAGQEATVPEEPKVMRSFALTEKGVEQAIRILNSHVKTLPARSHLEESAVYLASTYLWRKLPLLRFLWKFSGASAKPRREDIGLAILLSSFHFLAVYEIESKERKNEKPFLDATADTILSYLRGFEPGGGRFESSAYPSPPLPRIALERIFFLKSRTDNAFKIYLKTRGVKDARLLLSDKRQKYLQAMFKEPFLSDMFHPDSNPVYLDNLIVRTAHSYTEICETLEWVLPRRNVFALLALASSWMPAITPALTLIAVAGIYYSLYLTLVALAAMVSVLALWLFANLLFLRHLGVSIRPKVEKNN